MLIFYILCNKSTLAYQKLLLYFKSRESSLLEFVVFDSSDHGFARQDYTLKPRHVFRSRGFA